MTQLYTPNPNTNNSPRPNHTVVGYWYNGRVDFHKNEISTPDLREQDVILADGTLYRVFAEPRCNSLRIAKVNF